MTTRGVAAPVLTWDCPLCIVSGLCFTGEVDDAANALEEHIKRRHVAAVPGPRTRPAASAPSAQMRCTACHTPLHPAAVVGTGLTTHPGCDPAAQIEEHR